MVNVVNVLMFFVHVMNVNGFQNNIGPHCLSLHGQKKTFPKISFRKFDYSLLLKFLYLLQLHFCFHNELLHYTRSMLSLSTTLLEGNRISVESRLINKLPATAVSAIATDSVCWESSSALGYEVWEQKQLQQNQVTKRDVEKSHRFRLYISPEGSHCSIIALVWENLRIKMPTNADGSVTVVVQG